jgi:murein DD-endopeptidase MepM/ murein hydrolase activator NlpD/ribosome-associated translation inhibitor RaiA
MTTACLACLVVVPFAEKKFLKNDVGYYSVTFNGVQIGSANSKEEAEQAYANARLRFSQDYSSVIYMNPNCEIKEESKTVATRMSQAELESSIYSNLFECVVNMDKQLAYTVKVGDFTVTLASRDEVVELLEKITSKYDDNNEFQVSLSSEDSAYGTYSIDVVKSEIKSTDTDIVAAALNGTLKTSGEDGALSIDGLTEIGFSEDIVVCETAKANANVVSVQDAYDAITKEKEEKTKYVVVPGDCLSTIAQNNGLSLKQLLELNDGLTENSLIAPGDEIVITVPKAEVSVITTKRMTYEEDYNADITYVDDNNSYRGTNTVISEGTTGHRKVTADITYENGKQKSINYIKQTIMTESQPKVVSVGTLTPPTYVRPLYGGSVSSYYGYRDGEFHKGIDWSVSIGSTVRAAASGTVTRAGFYGDYGYCVEISHGNGTMTRYAHLNSIAVSNGQSVSQGQTIAYSGNTGRSTGPHLHFEIWIGGSTVNPLNYVDKY